ncbi:MAG TPA: hypothetical protein VLJ16_06535 [Acidobacteriota bacterium]|nr:hypothetical protein [Acidobacteriota bacterium]
MVKRRRIILTAIVIAALGPLPGVAPVSAQTRPGQSDLAAVLKKAAEYCRRLDKAALDFTCLEEVKETTHFYTPSTDIYLYDYQFVRKGEGIKEQRNLVSVNGKKSDRRDTRLYTASFQYKNVLFGPIGLLSEFWQVYHDYKVVGHEMIRNTATLVVEVTPKPEIPVTHPYGRVWIKPGDGSVFKIAWDQRSLGNYKLAEEWGTANDAVPQITAYTEYGFEKNGLRFPSLNYTQEAYIRKNGRKYESAEISTAYRGYKFFTVETAVTF